MRRGGKKAQGSRTPPNIAGLCAQALKFEDSATDQKSVKDEGGPSRMKEQLINLEYLKFFCRQHQLVVGGRAPSGKQFWVSPMGPHSQDLSYDEVQRALVATGSFELKEMLWNEDADNVSYFVTRQELESELKELIH